jgi:hypothetical protein
MEQAPFDLADALNRGCACQTLQPDLLRAQLERDPRLQGLHQSLAQTHPHLFSSTVVFLTQEVLQAMENTVAAIERVMALPAWQQAIATRFTGTNPQALAPLGAFMGYDFHVAAKGPQLIEINTNAGGAFMNAALARAQSACCEAMDQALTPYRNMAALETTFFAMFQAEWQRQRGGAPLRRVAIVDDAPQEQYLAPEFELARAMFEAHGIQASIADARTLHYEDGQLHCSEGVVDLVYNRVTDFDLSDPSHAALAQAWRNGAVVLTPHPLAHALRADKQHLQTLADPDVLRAMGAQESDIAVITAHVPPCERVTSANAQRLWETRRSLFFKPRCGFGSRAVYRGDKLTQRVWKEIVAGDYLAQVLVTPGLRSVRHAPVSTELKFDVRAYAYAGQVQLLGARMYTGQTTNFRTEGGGFAPLVVVAPETAQRYRDALLASTA